MMTARYIEARRQQAQRRLSELEVAVGIGDTADLAWHITQATRSGASLPDILDAVKLGIKMRGEPGDALRQCTDGLIERVFRRRDESWFTRQSIVETLSPC